MSGAVDRVCVVGGGGREHALASVLGRTADVVVTPGNPGIPGSVSTPPEQLDADLFVIGPEAPLVAGLADRLRGQGRLVFGPGADGAMLEGSKAQMKDVLVRAGVPTAEYASFGADEQDRALDCLEGMGPIYVIKTDGLAAGKGVLVTEDLDAARRGVLSYLSGDAFGEAGQRIVIEEGLTGPELSVFAVCDGERATVCGWAQDHKRLGDGDTGPNTGGMGAYSPVPGVDDVLIEQIVATCIDPTVQTLRDDGIDYRGFLFCGLMLTPTGPKVLEYNVRFGDPEAQVVLPRLTSDLTGLLAAASAGALGEPPVFSQRSAVCVVVASDGYPASPRTGDRIEGLAAASALEDVEVFCAGVTTGDDGGLITGGGRVLSVVGFGPDVTEARRRAYAALAELSWPGMQYRSDIASRAR